MIGSHKMGIRLLSLLLCLVTCVTMALPVMAVEADTEVPAVQTEAQTLASAVHYRAGSSYAIIGHLENGTTVTVLSETNSYYKIDCYEMNGYIAKSQVAQKEDGTYYVNCIADAADTKVMTYTPYSDAIRLRHSLVDLAKMQLGYPYVLGGTRPGGFDCSGLTCYLYNKAGNPISRTLSVQLKDGIIVSRENLMPGDLVFFNEYPRSNLVTHVGIYIGDGKIIHSGSRGVGYADLDGVWFRDYYIGARRVLNTGNTQLQETLTASLVADSGALRTASGRTAGNRTGR